MGFQGMPWLNSHSHGTETWFCVLQYNTALALCSPSLLEPNHMVLIITQTKSLNYVPCVLWPPGCPHQLIPKAVKERWKVGGSESHKYRGKTRTHPPVCTVARARNENPWKDEKSRVVIRNWSSNCNRVWCLYDVSYLGHIGQDTLRIQHGAQSEYNGIILAVGK